MQGEDLNAAIAALWARQRGEMLHRVDVVDATLAALSAGALDDEERDAGVSAAHKIAGAAGSFGFAAASDHARTIELALREGAGTDDAARLTDLATLIRDDFAAPRDEPEEQEEARVIVAAGALDEELRACFDSRGVPATVLSPGTEPGASVTAAVVDLDQPGADELIAQIGERAVVVGISRQSGLDARVRFARAGGRTLVPADTSPAEIVETVVQVQAGIGDDGSRALVVDDDPTLLELTSTILRGSGLDVTTLDDPSRFWQTLEACNPDVLLLDLEMPGYSGTDLCRAVRADPRWSQLPVLFLTGRTEPEAVRVVFEAGADDYLAKPVTQDELIQRIQNRLERVQQLRDLADKDGLTGVANRRKASAELMRLERLARRYRQPFTLAIIDIDHFKRVNDGYGHDTGDEVLRRLGRRLQSEFRGEDVVGRWGGEEFVVGMYGMPGDLAVDRLGALLDDWKTEQFDDPAGGSFTTTFTVGLAELPGVANTLDALQQAADDALYRGKAAGRSRVQMAGTAEVPAETVDIALVEDDTAIVDLLSHALSGEGWTLKTLADGDAALDALASDPARVQARLVLLDWNLPGLDGFSVLRRLRESGVLGRTRVVMLTARTSDADVLRALELGASDHIAKPFSLPVLLEKLRRILATR